MYGFVRDKRFLGSLKHLDAYFLVGEDVRYIALRVDESDKIVIRGNIHYKYYIIRDDGEGLYVYDWFYSSPKAIKKASKTTSKSYSPNTSNFW